MRKLFFVVTGLVVLAVTAGACGGGGSKTIKTNDGQVTVNKSLPSDFPKDFPIYKGAKFTGGISGSTSSGGANIQGFSGTWQTGDSVADVKAYYAEQFGGKSAWTQDSQTDAADSSFFAAHKTSDPTQRATLVISTADNKTQFVAFIGNDPTGAQADATDVPTSSSSSGSKTSTPSSSSGSGGDNAAATLPAEATLASDFPKDRVSFPSGARITSTSSISSGGVKTYFVEIYVKDTPENAAKYFKNELPNKGWTESLSSNSGDEYFSSYSAGNDSSEVVIVTATKAEQSGYATVTLSVSVKG
ncbi:MAG: hypothetical protein HYX50_01435 [Chloroflexi bacterium]|nr:hypothetical protein [Chloroflexota bacterium]